MVLLARFEGDEESQEETAGFGAEQTRGKRSVAAAPAAATALGMEPAVATSPSSCWVWLLRPPSLPRGL